MYYFAGLPSLHYGEPTAFAHNAFRLRHSNTVLAPLPAHSGAQITRPPQPFIATSALELRVDGFV